MKISHNDWFFNDGAKSEIMLQCHLKKIVNSHIWPWTERGNSILSPWLKYFYMCIWPSIPSFFKGNLHPLLGAIIIKIAPLTIIAWVYIAVFVKAVLGSGELWNFKPYWHIRITGIGTRKRYYRTITQTPVDSSVDIYILI